jgi:dihydropyrimidinase
MAVTWYSEQVQREMRTVFNEDGITSFKIFMAYVGAIGIDDEELIGVMKTAHDLGALVTAHCEHGLSVQAAQRDLIAAGKTAPKYHAHSRPTWVEGEATNRAIVLGKCEDVPLYIVHLTCRESMDAVYRAHAEGQTVWVETCPQYLLLDDSVYDQPDFEGAAYVMSPPIRPAGHQEYLWNGLRAGAIHTVATDHCPFRQADQKSMGKDDFTKIPNGAAGIEHRLPLMYTHGVAEGRISLEQFVDVCCTRPAKLFDLYPKKGAIRPGSDADIVVYDPTTTQTISAETHASTCDRNIFEGFEIKGSVTHTFVRGELVYEDGDLRVTRGNGRYLPRKRSRNDEQNFSRQSGSHASTVAGALS